MIGSDRSVSVVTEDLVKKGITVTTDQRGDAVTDDVDLLVYSEAIPAHAPERLKATKLGIYQQSYPEAVGAYTHGKKLIAICGTHGKSSTTAMVVRVLLEAEQDPTVIVGTRVRELQGRNWRKGKGEWFVLEACEYKRAFLHYSPTIILLTTCDGDHFDYYKSFEDYQSAFRSFIHKLPATGTLITHVQNPDCAPLTSEAPCAVLDADTQPRLTLSTPGTHMQQNAQLVLALGERLSLKRKTVETALRGYAGSWRRMEVKGTQNGVTVIDDYAHHPAEVSATIQAISSAYPSRRLICVFQPHTHDRALKLYDSFTKAFQHANMVIVPNVYVARAETEGSTMDVDTFVRAIEAQSGVTALNGHSMQETETLLRTKILKQNDVLLCMGAGDITQLASRMASPS